ncbi:DUF2971 domain-containing protein [Paenibacillus sp. 203]|uniref:DUF2971 domain-containing protein n=1 Tax=Paenibacillus sp. 203 TaxID=3096765 RepID=UPI001F356F7F|nr:DUF2971 domain-containing protein [Paenibacillus sp. UKAQ_18]
MQETLQNSRIDLFSLGSVYEYWTKQLFKPHIACFSKHGDLLSQWRSYANDGRGVAIGFDRDYFNAIKSTENKDFVIKDVIYDSQRQIEIINEKLSEEKIIEEYKKYNFTNTNIDIRSINVVSQILRYGMTFKSTGFSEEQEVRIIYGYDEVFAEPDVFKYRATEDDLISFIEIPLNPKHEVHPIAEVIMGPKCKADIEGVKGLLSKYLYVHRVELIKSKCTYR